MPLQATSGAASYDAFGGGVAAVPNYIEECFSTTLYTGNGSTQTITNGIDLAGKGGLVWAKKRSQLDNHVLLDTSRGLFSRIFSNTTGAAVTSTKQLDSFNADGFTIASTGAAINESGETYASWTFREQPKFFDVVTYSGNSVAGRVINHNLGSAPGVIIVKVTDAVDSWLFWHRSIANNGYARLNSTAAAVTTNTQFKFGNGTTTVVPDATSFTVGDDGDINSSGKTYVAYLFAHNAGGFGLTGTDNVISCGSFTPDALGNATVNLGYEPQWILYKGASGAGGTDSWVILDTMRGWDLTASDRRLFPNSSGAENTSSAGFPTATGFQVENLSASPYIYIAIRRGPMKVPTTGTSVFAPATWEGNGVNSRLISGPNFPPDLTAIRGLAPAGFILNPYFFDRLRGNGNGLTSDSTGAESGISTASGAQFNTFMTGILLGTSDGGSGNFNGVAGQTRVGWTFRRAPGFFDEVCYTGTSVLQVVPHNLGVAPELMIIKRRTAAASWAVYSAPTGHTAHLFLNSNAAAYIGSGYWNQTNPTSTNFTVEGFDEVDIAGSTYVAYLFASCPGVSKVGSYTGNGSSQTINCGFTGGARFVMIKRANNTGDWYVWDTARGIVSGNDPHLSLNTTAAEVTNTDTIDTDSTGFVVNQVSATNVNVSGGTYIFLAIA
jgi:hypothetical protein